MAGSASSRIPAILKKHESDLLEEWLKEQAASGIRRDDLTKEAEQRQVSAEFLRAFQEGAQAGEFESIHSPVWTALRDLLREMSRTRALQGYTPTQTANFVFSFKKPLFERMRREIDKDAAALADEVWRATAVLDAMGLYTTEVFQKSREEIIARQQQEMMELSTPVVKLWEGILALPIIGTLDSARTQVVMESLLQKIVETGSEVAIIDITGVPMVDTLVAQHLLKTVTAARLMGADCIISGIRPQIAQTIVHLGVTLSDVVTKASLADAFMLALRRSGMRIERIQK